MSVYQQLLNRDTKLSVVGLGYVGLPIAVAFSKHVDVIGYDSNPEKIQAYKNGIDPTNEVGSEGIQQTTMQFSTQEEDLKQALFHIIAVPTPINLDKTPDLTPVTRATEVVGKNLQRGAIVVYESTVYPGVTEDICIPLLEKMSGLKCGQDFYVGYSPERINPGDKVHRLETIVKIVSAMDEATLDEVAKVYEIVIEAGVHRASSIKVAEAAKVVENSQRDINIAFMNELALVFDRMGIDTHEVIDAMNTKWNALKFTPGLVGGHCIGVDPYYFVYQAENLGYHSQIISAGRKINDGMGAFVGDAIIKQLVLAGKKVKDATVAILGITFKENCPDTRNSKVADIVNRLREYGIDPLVVDPQANAQEAYEEYGVKLVDIKDVTHADCVVTAVSHQEFVSLSLAEFDRLFDATLPMNERIVIDVKGVLPKDDLLQAGYTLWRL